MLTGFRSGQSLAGTEDVFQKLVGNSSEARELCESYRKCVLSKETSIDHVKLLNEEILKLRKPQKEYLTQAKWATKHQKKMHVVEDLVQPVILATNESVFAFSSKNQEFSQENHTFYKSHQDI